MADSEARDVTKVVNLLKEAAEISLEVEELEKKSRKLRKEAEELCTHPVVHTEEYYSPGGYLDKESTTYIKKCCLCGKVISRESIEGENYG